MNTDKIENIISRLEIGETIILAGTDEKIKIHKAQNYYVSREFYSGKKICGILPNRKHLVNLLNSTSATIEETK